VPLELVIEGHGGIAFGAPVYPEAALYLLEGSDEPLLTYVGQFEVVIPVTADKDAKPGNRAVPGELRYQACNSRMCLFPASVPVSLQVVVTGPGDETKKK
jgi:hypothetical protein